MIEVFCARDGADAFNPVNTGSDSGWLGPGIDAWNGGCASWRGDSGVYSNSIVQTAGKRASGEIDEGVSPRTHAARTERRQNVKTLKFAPLRAVMKRSEKWSIRFLRHPTLGIRTTRPPSDVNMRTRASS